MIYGMRVLAESAAQGLSRDNHSTFSVYKEENGWQYRVINGVEEHNKNRLIAQYQNGNQRI